MDKNKSIHPKKKRITHIGNSLDCENKDNSSNNILESILNEMSSSIELAHNNISEKREAHKIEVETKNRQKNNEISKCKINFVAPKKFPLMEKCQKAFKTVKFNRCVPKPRAHLAADLDFPTEELADNSSKSLHNKKVKQSAKVKVKEVISESSSNLSSHKLSKELLKQNSAAAAKFKTKSSSSMVSKKNMSSNIIQESRCDRMTRTIDKNARIQKSSSINIKSANVKASTSIKNINTKPSNVKAISKNSTSESSDSDHFESFLKNYKIPKKILKKKENLKLGKQNKIMERPKKNPPSTIITNKQKIQLPKTFSSEQHDSSNNSSSEDDVESEQIKGKHQSVTSIPKKKKSEISRLKQNDSLDSDSTENIIKSKQMETVNPRKKARTTCRIKKKPKIAKDVSFKNQNSQYSNNCNFNSSDDSDENYSVGNATCKSKKKSQNYKRVSFKNNLNNYNSDLDSSDDDTKSEWINRKKPKKPVSRVGKNRKETNISKKAFKNQLCDNLDGDSNLASSGDNAEGVPLKIGPHLSNMVKETGVDILKTNSAQLKVTATQRRYSLRSKRNIFDESSIAGFSNDQECLVNIANSFEGDVETTVANNYMDDNLFDLLPVDNEMPMVEELTSVEDKQILAKDKDCTNDNMESLEPTEASMEQKSSDESDIEIIEVISPSNRGEKNYCKSVVTENIDIETNPNKILSPDCVTVPAVKQEIEKHDPVFATGMCEDTADITHADDDVVYLCDENAQNVKQEKVDEDIIFECETKPTIPKSGLMESGPERFSLKRKSEDSLHLTKTKSEFQKISKISTENNFVAPIDALINDPFLGNIARNAYNSTVRPFQELDLPDLIDVYKKEFNVYQTILTAEQNMEVGIKMVEAHQAVKLKTIREYIEKRKSTLVGEKVQCNEVKFEKTENPSSSQSRDYKQSTPEPLKNIKIETDVTRLDAPPQPVVDHASVFVKEEVHDNPEDVKPELLLVGKKCSQCHKDAASACQRCAKVFFCSNKCGRQYWNDGHKNDCGKNVDAM